MIQEFIDGKSLQSFFEQGPITMGTRKIIMKGILQGLAEMEAMKIVHRDIKPENAMITPQLDVKIIDFGLATYSD